MNVQIKVDSEEFWTSLKSDIRAAKDYVFIQTLCVEGDRVGKRLAEELLSCSGLDIRIILDTFSKFVLSDKFLYSPINLFNRQLRQEAKETKQTIVDLENAGIKVKWVTPTRPFPIGLIERNHKKLVAIDNKIAYVGGFNFSEHNFHWHDLMLRIEGTAIAEFLREDFLATWEGNNRSGFTHLPEIEFHIFDGISNEKLFQRIFQLLDTAKEQIFIETPYLSFPFTEKFRELRQKGVAITLITAEANNREFYNEYVRWEAARADIELHLYQGRMTHLKSMLIDDKILIVGSANFDLYSYLYHQEIIAAIADPKVISEFKDRVIKQDLKNSIHTEAYIPSWQGRLNCLQVKGIYELGGFLYRLSKEI